MTSVGTLSSLAVSGNVGIGTTSASSPLVVNGGIATLADAGGNGFIAVGRSSDNFAWAPLAKQNNNTTYEGGIQWTPAGANITIGTTLATAMTILSSGNVGIGTTSPSYILDVTGQARFTGGYTISDRRWKTNITPLKDALSMVTQLQGVSFDWKRKEFPEMHFGDGQQIGFVAQDVEKVLPQIVSTDNKGYKNVSYESVIPVLTEAVKELKADNDNQAAKIKTLTARLNALEAKPH